MQSLVNYLNKYLSMELNYDSVIKVRNTKSVLPLLDIISFYRIKKKNNLCLEKRSSNIFNILTFTACVIDTSEELSQS